MPNVRGADVWKVPGTDGLVLAVAPAAGSPSVSADLPFLFTRAAFVEGVLAFVRPVGAVSVEVQQANLGMRIVDEVAEAMIVDTRGTLVGTTNAPVAASLLMMAGFGFRPFALQRPVSAGDKWVFSLQNEDPLATSTLAGIFLYFGRP